ncbi:MAG: SDR family NAD(P)-dependent oxidoreductase [Propionibacteriaceae bacterium]|nr:SDR family NAD(P)-dependent oxidoreductase [Propionibacteriaceae bacterium]
MKTIVLTGASDGVGAQAALQLAQQGHRLLLVGRTEAKLAAVSAKANLSEYFVADYEKLDDVHRLANEITGATDHIDVLVNNAGGVFPGPVITPDGFERTFQVNYLAGFLLTHELMELLLASQAAVINTASVAAKAFGRIDLADFDGRDRFKSMRAYGSGKLADVLHARGLHARYHQRGLAAMAFHPGNVATNFAADFSGGIGLVYKSPLKHLLISATQGGANLAYFAAGTPGETWVSDEYYHSNRRGARTHDQAYDSELIRQFWDLTNDRLGLTDI